MSVSSGLSAGGVGAEVTAAFTAGASQRAAVNPAGGQGEGGPEAQLRDLFSPLLSPALESSFGSTPMPTPSTVAAAAAAVQPEHKMTAQQMQRLSSIFNMPYGVQPQMSGLPMFTPNFASNVAAMQLQPPTNSGAAAGGGMAVPKPDGTGRIAIPDNVMPWISPLMATYAAMLAKATAEVQAQQAAGQPNRFGQQHSMVGLGPALFGMPPNAGQPGHGGATPHAQAPAEAARGGDHRKPQPREVKQGGRLVTYWSCWYCGKEFSLRRNCARHQKTHDVDTKRHRCELCGVTYRRKSDLRTHVRVHTGEKPYNCKLCRKEFARTSDLRSHERRHSDQDYKCNDCAGRFLKKSHLRSHTCDPTQPFKPNVVKAISSTKVVEGASEEDRIEARAAAKNRELEVITEAPTISTVVAAADAVGDAVKPAVPSLPSMEQHVYEQQQQMQMQMQMQMQAQSSTKSMLPPTHAMGGGAQQDAMAKQLQAAYQQRQLTDQQRQEMAARHSMGVAATSTSQASASAASQLPVFQPSPASFIPVTTSPAATAAAQVAGNAFYQNSQPNFLADLLQREQDLTLSSGPSEIFG